MRAAGVHLAVLVLLVAGCVVGDEAEQDDEILEYDIGDVTCDEDQAIQVSEDEAGNESVACVYPDELEHPDTYYCSSWAVLISTKTYRGQSFTWCNSQGMCGRASYSHRGYGGTYEYRIPPYGLCTN